MQTSQSCLLWKTVIFCWLSENYPLWWSDMLEVSPRIKKHQKLQNCHLGNNSFLPAKVYPFKGQPGAKIDPLRQKDDNHYRLRPVFVSCFRCRASFAWARWRWMYKSNRLYLLGQSARQWPSHHICIKLTPTLQRFKLPISWDAIHMICLGKLRDCLI